MSTPRTAGHPSSRALATLRSVLQVDGYPGFKRLAGERADASVGLAFGWAEVLKVLPRILRAHAIANRAEVLAKIRTLTQSKTRYAAIPPNNGDRCGRREVGLSSRPYIAGQPGSRLSMTMSRF
jgi:hypothetical protein